jgi:LemA protein
MSRMVETIKRIFPQDFKELVPVQRRWWQNIDFNNLKSKEALWISLAAAIIILPGIYYYNKLIELSRYTEMEQHQIDVQLQRRKDLSANLTKTVMDYAEHERAMFQYMADRRAGSPSSKLDPITNALEKNGLADLVKMNTGLPANAMGKILALAEAYPDLKLSANFQVLMQGLIHTEDNIAARRMAYNEAASNFHAYVRKVPACFYAFIFGYREKMFHYVDVDTDLKKYSRIAY